MPDTPSCPVCDEPMKRHCPRGCGWYRCNSCRHTVNAKGRTVNDKGRIIRPGS